MCAHIARLPPPSSLEDDEELELLDEEELELLEELDDEELLLDDEELEELSDELLSLDEDEEPPNGLRSDMVVSPVRNRGSP